MVPGVPRTNVQTIGKPSSLQGFPFFTAAVDESKSKTKSTVKQKTNISMSNRLLPVEVLAKFLDVGNLRIDLEIYSFDFQLNR